MAKTSLNPIFEGFSRSLGNITFYERNGETIVRRKSEPKDAKTPAQVAVRKSFAQASQDWKALPSCIKKSWEKNGSGATAYNRYIGKNVPSLSEGEAASLCIKGELPSFTVFSANSNAPGKILVTYQAAISGNEIITVFHRPIAQAPDERGRFTAAQSAASPSGTVTLENFKAGVSYEVHAILSDAELAAAVKVSSSAAVICRVEQ